MKGEIHPCTTISALHWTAAYVRLCAACPLVGHSFWVLYFIRRVLAPLIHRPQWKGPSFSNTARRCRFVRPDHMAFCWGGFGICHACCAQWGKYNRAISRLNNYHWDWGNPCGELPKIHWEMVGLPLVGAINIRKPSVRQTHIWRCSRATLPHFGKKSWHTPWNWAISMQERFPLTNHGSSCIIPLTSSSM